MLETVKACGVEVGLTVVGFTSEGGFGHVLFAGSNDATVKVFFGEEDHPMNISLNGRQCVRANSVKQLGEFLAKIGPAEKPPVTTAPVKKTKKRTK
ncbi:MAG: hypothetical protein WCF94_00590 [bacterium]